MSIMTFKTDLIPNTDLEYSLGSNDYKWNIYGQITRQGVSKGWNKGRDGVVAGTTVPDYEEWGTGKVKVDGRIWIYVK